MSLDFTTAIADLDTQIDQAAQYLKKLRKHKRQLIKIQAEEAAIAALEVPVNPSDTEPEPCYQKPVETDNNGPAETVIHVPQWVQQMEASRPLMQKPETSGNQFQAVGSTSDIPTSMYQTLDRQQLRDACKAAGIKWRSVHGPNKHLSKAEMIAALEALQLPQVA